MFPAWLARLAPVKIVGSVSCTKGDIDESSDTVTKHDEADIPEGAVNFNTAWVLVGITDTPVISDEFVSGTPIL